MVHAHLMTHIDSLNTNTQQTCGAKGKLGDLRQTFWIRFLFAKFLLTAAITILKTGRKPVC